MKKDRYLILELANSHNGSVNQIFSLLNKLDNFKNQNIGLKFQIISKDFLSLKNFKWYPVYQKLYFSRPIWKKIINKALTKEANIWIDIFDVYGVQILKDNFKKIYGIKLQSSVLYNNELLSAINQLNLKRKKIIINVAGYDYKEIFDLSKKFTSIFKSKPILQLGFQNFPTQDKYIHINKISFLKKLKNDYEISFADHVGYKDKNFLNLPLLAYQLNYKYVEKHICLNRKTSKYDYVSAAEPKDLNKILYLIKKNKKMKIKEFKKYYRNDFISSAEKKYLISSILLPIAKKDLKKGTIINDKDIIYRRTSIEGLNYNSIRDKIENKYILSKTIKKFSTFKNNSFKKSKIGIIVAGRMKSSRLKNKALKKIFNQTSISRCMSSCKKIKSLNKIILATSYLKSDNPLALHKYKPGIKIFRGHPEDVIDRFIKAAEKYNLNVIVRATADCPYISGEIVDLLVKSHFENGADFTYASNAAPGSSVEIYNLATLKFIKEKKKNTDLSEYMTWYVMNNRDFFRINKVDLPRNLSRNYRLTLDYYEDLKFFNILYKKLYQKKLVVNLINIFKILDRDISLRNINKNCKLVFKTNKKLISFLNKETKF